MPDTVAVASRRNDSRGRRRHIPEQSLRADLGAPVRRRCRRRGSLARPGPPPRRPAAAAAVAERALPVLPRGWRAGGPVSQPGPSAGHPAGAHPVEPAVARVQLGGREVRRVNPEVSDVPAGQVVSLLDHHRVQPQPGARRVHREGLRRQDG